MLDLDEEDRVAFIPEGGNPHPEISPCQAAFLRSALDRLAWDNCEELLGAVEQTVRP